MTDAERLALLGRLGRPAQHDVNNLLMAISGNLALLRRDAQDPAALRRLERIDAAMERSVSRARSSSSPLSSRNSGSRSCTYVTSGESGSMPVSTEETDGSARRRPASESA